MLQIRSDLSERKYPLQFPGIEPQFLGRLTRRLVISVDTDELTGNSSQDSTAELLLNMYSNVSAGQEACIAFADNVGTKPQYVSGNTVIPFMLYIWYERSGGLSFLSLNTDITRIRA